MKPSVRLASSKGIKGQAIPWVIWRQVKRLALEVYASLCGKNVAAFVIVLFGEDMLETVSECIES